METEVTSEMAYCLFSSDIFVVVAVVPALAPQCLLNYAGIKLV